MKKFLNIFFAAALIMVSAQSLYAAADLKFNGEYRVRGYSYNTVNGVGNGGNGADYIDQRFMLNGTVTQGMTTGVVELGLLRNSNGPQEGYIWGDPNGASGPGMNVAHGGIHQAYMNMTFPVANLVAGRRIVKLGNGLILNETVDNLALSIPLQMLTLDLAYVKLAEADLGVQGGGAGQDMDNNGYLINAGLKPMETWNLGLFYFTNSTKTVAARDNDTKNAFGLTVNGQAGPLGIALEYDNLGGTVGGTAGTPTGRGNYKGQNLLFIASGDLGVAKAGLGYIRITGASACTSGTCDTSNNSIAGDFQGGHGVLLTDQTRYGNGVDLNTRVADAALSATQLNNNFHAIKLFAETAPMADLNVGIEIFPYVQLVDSDVGKTLLGGKTDTNIGQEFNIYGGYKLDKNLTLSGVIAFLNAGDVIKDLPASGGNSTNMTKLNAALTYTF